MGRPATRQRVLSEAVKLGYLPNLSAQVRQLFQDALQECQKSFSGTALIALKNLSDRPEFDRAEIGNAARAAVAKLDPAKPFEERFSLPRAPSFSKPFFCRLRQEKSWERHAECGDPAPLSEGRLDVAPPSLESFRPGPEPVKEYIAPSWGSAFPGELHFSGAVLPVMIRTIV